MTRRESVDKRHKRIRSKVGGAALAQPPARRSDHTESQWHLAIWISHIGNSRCCYVPKHKCSMPVGIWKAHTSFNPACLRCPVFPATARCLQVEGTPERPRLAVFRSNNHIYAQVRQPSGAAANAFAVHSSVYGSALPRSPCPAAGSSASHASGSPQCTCARA